MKIGINTYFYQNHLNRSGRSLFQKMNWQNGIHPKSTPYVVEMGPCTGHPDFAWLIDQVQRAWESTARRGYRDGVMLVSLPEETFQYFTCPITRLVEGDKLTGEYAPRIVGETPRKHTYVSSPKQPSPISQVDVVLYARETLEEGDEPRTGADWDIITVLAQIDVGEIPMQPGTLMANHFLSDGGTKTNMTDSEFVEALKKSHDYWKDKSMILSPSIGYRNWYNIEGDSG